MLFVSEVDPVTDPRWDKFVETHEYGWITHLSAWKHILQESFSLMKGHYLVLEDENHTIRAGLPVYEVSSWIFGKKLVSIPFATISDPLVANSNELDELLAAAFNLSDEHTIKKMELRSCQANKYFNHPELKADHSSKQHTINLNTKLEDLFKQFHKSCTARCVKKSLKSDLTFVEADKEDELKTFYEIYMSNRKRVGLPPLPYTFLKAIWQYLKPQNQIKLFLAKHKNQFIGGIIALTYKDRVSLEFLASRVEFLPLFPNHFLIWHGLKYAYDCGYQKFDFGRTAETNKGLMTFKQRWGTEVSDLTCFHYPGTNGKAYKSREQSISYNLFVKIYKRIPNYFCRKIGDLAYQHLV